MHPLWVCLILVIIGIFIIAALGQIMPYFIQRAQPYSWSCSYKGCDFAIRGASEALVLIAKDTHERQLEHKDG